MIGEDTLAQIRKATNLAALIGGKCPGCESRRVEVGPLGERWFCPDCFATGDCFRVLELRERASFLVAAGMCAAKAGIAIKPQPEDWSREANRYGDR